MIPAGIKDVVYILMLRLLHQFHDCKIQHKNIVNNFSGSSDCPDDIKRKASTQPAYILDDTSLSINYNQ